jgi:hypothetical protein
MLPFSRSQPATSNHAPTPSNNAPAPSQASQNLEDASENLQRHIQIFEDEWEMRVLQHDTKNRELAERFGLKLETVEVRLNPLCDANTFSNYTIVTHHIILNFFLRTISNLKPRF